MNRAASASAAGPSPAVFLLVGAAVAIGGEWFQRARRDARRRSTCDLLRREAHLRSILDTVPDAMIVIDEARPHPVFQRRGRAAVRLTAAEVIGQNVSMLMPSPYREAA